jgi:hypothetical protein
MLTAWMLKLPHLLLYMQYTCMSTFLVPVRAVGEGFPSNLLGSAGDQRHCYSSACSMQLLPHQQPSFCKLVVAA